MGESGMTDSKLCPECGGKRGCLTCLYARETPYETICLREHYGVTVGEGCDDWKCAACRVYGGHEEKVMK